MQLDGLGHQNSGGLTHLDGMLGSLAARSRLVPIPHMITAMDNHITDKDILGRVGTKGN